MLQWMFPSNRSQYSGVLHVLQCVAVCYSVLQWMSPGKQSQMSGVVHVLQYVAVCCRLLQGVAVDVFRQHVSNVSSEVIVHYHLSCRVLHGVAGCCRMLQGVVIVHNQLCRELRCVAVCCGVLQGVSGACKVLQCVVLVYSQSRVAVPCSVAVYIQEPPYNPLHLVCAIHCNTLQHTATHYNTLQHTATHCNTLLRTIHPRTAS